LYERVEQNRRERRGFIFRLLDQRRLAEPLHAERDEQPGLESSD
jgi:hypothetical protein